MESLSAALPVAGHAGSAGGLALPTMVLADVAGLVESERDERAKDQILVPKLQ